MGSSTGSKNVSLLSEIRHGERTGRRSVSALENIEEECVKSGGRTGGKRGGSEAGGSEDVVAAAGQRVKSRSASGRGGLERKLVVE